VYLQSLVLTHATIFIRTVVLHYHQPLTNDKILSKN
jgi:hypothetical protein